MQLSVIDVMDGLTGLVIQGCQELTIYNLWIVVTSFLSCRCSESSIQIEVGRFSVTLGSSVAEIDSSHMHVECGGAEDVTDFAERSMELSIEEDGDEDKDETPEVEVKFILLETGSQKGKPLLMESTGYTYVQKSSRGQKMYWRCSQRGKRMNCLATVIQHQGTFTRGSSSHSHPIEPGKLQEAQVKMKVKEAAMANLQESGHSIAEKVTDEVVGDNPVPGGLTDPDYLARIANR